VEGIAKDVRLVVVLGGDKTEVAIALRVVDWNGGRRGVEDEEEREDDEFITIERLGVRVGVVVIEREVGVREGEELGG